MLGYVGGPWTIEQTREMILTALDELAATGISILPAPTCT